jgi:hypothetical protein
MKSISTAIVIAAMTLIALIPVFAVIVRGLDMVRGMLG